MNVQRIGESDVQATRLFEAYQRKQYASLLAEVDELSKAGPLSPEVLGLAALSLSALDRHEEALKATESALTGAIGLARSQQAWLWSARAVAEAGLKQWEAAIAAQRQAVALEPAESIYSADLARYQRLGGHLNEALEAAQAGLARFPEDPQLWLELGQSLQGLRDATGALAAFRRVQELRPDAPEGYHHEGALHLVTGAAREARAALHTALAHSPGHLAVEDLLADSVASSTAWLGRALLHLLALSRVTLFGWLVIAFFYYVGFRVLEFIWKVWPATLPVGRAVLLVTLVYLLGGMAGGYLLRLAFRLGWPR